MFFYEYELVKYSYYFLLGHSDLVQLFLYSGFNPEQKDKTGQVKKKFHSFKNITDGYSSMNIMRKSANV